MFSKFHGWSRLQKNCSLHGLITEWIAELFAELIAELIAESIWGPAFWEVICFTVTLSISCHVALDVLVP